MISAKYVEELRYFDILKVAISKWPTISNRSQLRRVRIAPRFSGSLVEIIATVFCKVGAILL